MVEMGGLLSLECKGGETRPHSCSCFFHNTGFMSRNIIHPALKSSRLEHFKQKMHSNGQWTPWALNQAPSLPASQPTSHVAVGTELGRGVTGAPSPRTCSMSHFRVFVPGSVPVCFPSTGPSLRGVCRVSEEIFNKQFFYFYCFPWK